jgi:uncharacterized protein DUF4345
MKNSIIVKIILVLAGIIGAIVGAGMLFAPVAFHATSGIALDGSVNLMSEMRAAGGALLAAGLLITAGAFVPRLTFSSTLIAAFIYLSYGVSRLFSIAIDGVPEAALLQITAFEIIVGLICAFALFHYRELHSNAPQA